MAHDAIDDLDPELREVALISPESRSLILETMSYVLDGASLSSLKNLITSSESERIRLDAIQAWLGHRRSMADISMRLRNGNSNAAFNVYIGTNEGDSNVRRVKDAFLRDDDNRDG